MHICPECELVTTKDTSSGVIKFKCEVCGFEEEGDIYDVRMAGNSMSSDKSELMYERLIRSSAFDRVNQQVKKDCTKCGLDYMTQVRVGPRETIVWTCTCGNITEV